MQAALQEKFATFFSGKESDDDSDDDGSGSDWDGSDNDNNDDA